MQQYQAPFVNCTPFANPARLAANDPIGGVGDSVPVHPDDKHPGFGDFKRQKKREPIPDKSSDNPSGKQPDSGHQIDEYA